MKEIARKALKMVFPTKKGLRNAELTLKKAGWVRDGKFWRRPRAHK